MAFGQIDPARLDGDALRRWYMRSPADIEQERQQAANQRYQNFFGGGRGADPDDGADRESPADGQGIDPGIGTTSTPSGYADFGIAWVPAGPNRLRSVSTSPDEGSITQGAGDGGLGSPVANADRARRYQLAATSPSLPAATAWNCPTCHGRLPLPLPPQLQPLQPLFRNIPRYVPSGGGPNDRKQCEIQDRNDRRICGRQPLPQDKAICHASASVRWKNCLSTGEVGDPPLDTAKRLQGP